VLHTVLELIALPALAVAWIQWRLQRTSAGGRGLFLGADRTGHQVVRETPTGQVITNSYRVEVGIAGPKVWHELAVHLEKDGREFTVPEIPSPFLQAQVSGQPETRKSMSCDSERIIWDFYLSKEDGEKVWCVVSWAELRGAALRTDALAIALRGGPVYKWRWYPGHLYIGWLSEDASSHGPGWFRDRFGRPDLLADGRSPATIRCATVMVRSDLGVRRGRDGDPTRSFGPVGNAPSPWPAPRRERGGTTCGRPPTPRPAS
jgi:hypothetical protein